MTKPASPRPVASHARIRPRSQYPSTRGPRAARRHHPALERQARVPSCGQPQFHTAIGARAIKATASTQEVWQWLLCHAGTTRWPARIRIANAAAMSHARPSRPRKEWRRACQRARRDRAARQAGLPAAVAWPMTPKSRVTPAWAHSRALSKSGGWQPHAGQNVRAGPACSATVHAVKAAMCVHL